MTETLETGIIEEQTTGTPFIEIYERFLDKIDDFDISYLSDSEIEDFCKYLLFSQIDFIMPIKSSFEMDIKKLCFKDELLNAEKEILAIAMVSSWYDNSCNSTMLTKQFIGTKEEKFFSQSSHLSMLNERVKYLENKARKLRRDYGYNNMDMSEFQKGANK